MVQPTLTVPHKVLVFYLTVICEKVCYNVPHADVCKSSVSIKFSVQECLSNWLCVVFFGTLRVHLLFMFPARLCVVLVEIIRIDFFGPCRDDEWSWVWSCSSSRWDFHFHSYVLTIYVRLYWILELVFFNLLYVGGTYARLVYSWYRFFFARLQYW